MPLNPAIPGVTSGAAPFNALPGLSPASIGTVGGGVGQQNIIRTLFDYNPFSILRDIHERHLRVSDFRLLLSAMGQKRGVDAPTTGHYEHDWDRGLIRIGAVTTASTGAGTNLVLTLDATSMFNANAAIGGAARQSSEIKVRDILLSPTGKMGQVIAKNEALTPHTITVRPLKAAVDLDGAFVATGNYAIVGNAWAEGTGLPLGSVPRIVKYTNSFQIVKQASGITGSEASNRLFVRFDATPEGDGIFAAMNTLMWANYESDFSHTLLLGQTIDNITDVAQLSGTDVPVLGTEGLIPWVTDNGHTHTYNPAAYTLANFDALARTLWHERSGSMLAMTLDGYDVFTLTENLLLGESTEGVAQFITKQMMSKFEGLSSDDIQPFDNSDFGFYVGFKALRKGGMTYMFKLLHEFSAAKGLGHSAYNYNNYRVVLPVGEIMDRKTNKAGFMWGYEYKQKDSYSREMQYGQVGGIGTMGLSQVTVPVHQYDHVQWGMLSEVAGHFACPNKVIIQKPA